MSCFYTAHGIVAVATAMRYPGLRHHGEVTPQEIEIWWWRRSDRCAVRAIELVADLTGIGVRRREPGHATIERRVDASVRGWDLATLLARELAWLSGVPREGPQEARGAIDTGCGDCPTDKPDAGRKAGEEGL